MLTLRILIAGINFAHSRFATVTSNSVLRFSGGGGITPTPPPLEGRVSFIWLSLAKKHFFRQNLSDFVVQKNLFSFRTQIPKKFEYLGQGDGSSKFYTKTPPKSMFSRQVKVSQTTVQALSKGDISQGFTPLRRVTSRTAGALQFFGKTFSHFELVFQKCLT